MADSVNGVAISVYIILFLLFAIVTTVYINVVDRRISRIKGRYTLGQLPPLSSYGAPSFVQWVMFLWVASTAVLVAAAVIDQWASWEAGALSLQFGVLGATEGGDDTLSGSNETVSYTKLLKAFANIPPLAEQAGTLNLLFHYLQAAGILTLLWYIVALFVSCLGLVSNALYYRQQSQSLSRGVIQWWWSCRTYNWLAASRCLNAFVVLSWFALGGIPLIIDAGAQHPPIQFNFAVSWYLALISSVLITVASGIAGSQIKWDRIVRGAKATPSHVLQAAPHARQVATQTKAECPTSDHYGYNGNAVVASYQSRVSPHVARYSQYQSSLTPPPPTAASEREARIAAGWWPRWTYWR